MLSQYFIKKNSHTKAITFDHDTFLRITELSEELDRSFSFLLKKAFNEMYYNMKKDSSLKNPPVSMALRVRK